MDESEPDSDTTLRHAQTNQKFHQYSPSDKIPEERSTSKAKTKTFTKLNQFLADSKAKE